MNPIVPHEPQTVRETLRRIQAVIRTQDLDPVRARDCLMTLTALLGTCLEEIREADAAYAQVLLGHLNSTDAANRAKIKAEITPEYQRRQEARNTHTAMIEMIRSLKHYLRSQEEEMRLAR